MRRARSALGLRGRITAVVLLTAVATLAVAAVALLGPLEHSLRTAEQKTLARALNGSTRDFRTDVLCRPVSDINALKGERDVLERRIGGGIVTLFSATAPKTSLLPVTFDPTVLDDDNDHYDDASRAFATHATQRSIGAIDGTDYARESIYFTRTCPAPAGNPYGGTEHYVLAVRKSIAEIPNVDRVVNRAFLDAALAGLLLTIILGIPLSWRLVRRLRRLREAAIEVQHDGPEALVPVDNARDEVGDLSRALVSMQHRLRRQEEARRAFVATASHELRTPLASLDGMLELLGEDLADAEPDVVDARELLGRARAQSRRLGRLAADLLDLSRIDAQVELRSEPIELGELSRAVLAEFELGTRERSVRCTLEGQDGDPVWALGDPGSVARILRILLDNAVRVSPSQTHIAVSLVGGDDVAIRVRDQGPGVLPEEREAIFERFRRGRDTAGQAGFGLGLAIGRELARRMGGDLVLDPTVAPGACFTLRLPVAQAAVDDAVAVD
jgi:signal transduction histidine kinase